MSNLRNLLPDRFADALANPRRLAILDRLCRRPATTSELAAVARIALPTMHQHLQRLRDAGLITSVKHGRTVTHDADLAPFNQLENWMATQRSFWNAQLDSLTNALEQRHDH